MRSLDAGVSWSRMDGAGQSSYWAGICVSSDFTKMAASGDDALSMSFDGGVTWRKSFVASDSLLGFLAVSADFTKLILVQNYATEYTYNQTSKRTIVRISQPHILHSLYTGPITATSDITEWRGGNYSLNHPKLAIDQLAYVGASGTALCPEGTCSSAGSTSCTSCTAGRYNNRKGEAGSYCTSQCGNGKYSQPGATNCSACPAGKQSSLFSESCTPCNPGLYNEAGASSCTFARGGSYTTEMYYRSQNFHGFYNQFNFLIASEDLTTIVMGGMSLYKSVNSGYNWTSIDHIPITSTLDMEIGRWPYRGATCNSDCTKIVVTYADYHLNATHIALSTNGGFSWELLGSRYQSSAFDTFQPYDVVTSNASFTDFLVTRDGVLWRST